MKHQFHLAAFVICLAFWLGFTKALVVPALVASDFAAASPERVEFLNRVARQAPPPPPDMPPPPAMPPPPEMPPPPYKLSFESRKKREAKGGGSMPTRKG